MTTARQDVTQLLAAHAAGEESALPELFKRVYDELRLVARNQRRRVGGHATINTTGLVNEVYVKLAEGQAGAGHNRGHFFSIAARAMRQILVDYARAQGRAKRGGNRVRTDLKPDRIAVEGHTETILAIDRALEGLGDVDERLVKVVECHYFAGLTESETAEALGVSVSTIQRSLRAARTYLGQELATG